MQPIITGHTAMQSLAVQIERTACVLCLANESFVASCTLFKFFLEVSSHHDWFHHIMVRPLQNTQQCHIASDEALALPAIRTWQQPEQIGPAVCVVFSVLKGL